MKAIGKTFSAELSAAGLLGLPFAWGEDGDITFNAAMTQPQIDAVLAVYEAHDPQATPPWSPDATLWKLREARELVLNRLAGIGFAAYAGGDTATVTACLAARLSLLGMTTLPAVTAATDEQQLLAALFAAYMDIVAAAPPQLVSAFAQFNL